MIRSVRIGLRLCGIAEEPFWPAPNGSSTSRTSVRCRLRTSVAKRSRPAPAIAIREVSTAWRSRGIDLGGDVLALQPEPLHHPRLDRRRHRGVGADRAGELAEGELLEGVGEALEVAVGLEGEAGEAQAEGRRLGVDAVGAADAERVALLERPLDQRVAVGARRRRARSRRPGAAAGPAPCRARRRRSARSGSSGRARRPTRRRRRRRRRRRGR